MTDNLALSVHSHQIRFGVDYRRINSKAAFAAYESDAVFLTLSNLLANTVPEADVIARNDNVQLAFTNVSVFAQDTWKATRTFTITYRIESRRARPRALSTIWNAFGPLWSFSHANRK